MIFADMVGKTRRHRLRSIVVTGSMWSLPGFYLSKGRIVEREEDRAPIVWT